MLFWKGLRIIYTISEKRLKHQVGEPEKIFRQWWSGSDLHYGCKCLADVFGKEVYLSESHHSAAWGAAWTALVAIGKVDSFEEIKQNIPIEAIITTKSAKS